MVGMMPTTVCLYFMFFEFSENSNFKMLLVEFCGFVLLHMVDCEKLGRILWLLSYPLELIISTFFRLDVNYPPSLV